MMKEEIVWKIHGRMILSMKPEDMSCFGKNGEVLKKSEDWKKKEQISENFTVTNQNTGILAIRAEVYEEFSGTVKGSVKEKSGIEYLLNCVKPISIVQT